MVTTDISQLTAECTTWRANLRKLREEINGFKQRLQEIASRQTSRSTLQDVEQYHNQFHIQLINIHDLKQAIKEHERHSGWELSSGKGISDGVWSKHEELYDRYQYLDHTLQELKEHFEQFARRNT